MRLCFSKSLLETRSFQKSLCNLIKCHSSNKVGSALSSCGNSIRQSGSFQDEIRNTSTAFATHLNRADEIQYFKTEKTIEQVSQSTQLVLCCAMTEKSTGSSAFRGNFMNRCKHDLTKKHLLRNTNGNEKPTMMDVGLQVGEEQLLSCEDSSSEVHISSALIKESEMQLSSEVQKSPNKEALNHKSSQISPKSSQSTQKSEPGSGSPQRPCLSHDKIMMFADEVSTSDTGNESSPHTPDQIISPNRNCVSV